MANANAIRNIDPDQIYAPGEIGVILRKSLTSVYRMIRKGSLNAVKIEGEWQVSGKDLLDYYEKCRVWRIQRGNR